MSATSKIKKFAVDNFKLVQKEDSNKRERIHTNQSLKNIARNPSAAMNEDEEIDDTPFFQYDEEE